MMVHAASTSSTPWARHECI